MFKNSKSSKRDDSGGSLTLEAVVILEPLETLRNLSALETMKLWKLWRLRRLWSSEDSGGSGSSGGSGCSGSSRGLGSSGSSEALEALEALRRLWKLFGGSGSYVCLKRPDVTWANKPNLKPYVRDPIGKPTFGKTPELLFAETRDQHGILNQYLEFWICPAAQSSRQPTA